MAVGQAAEEVVPGGPGGSKGPVAFSGWLLQEHEGNGLHRSFRRRYFWLAGDRLCYAAGPKAGAPPPTPDPRPHLRPSGRRCVLAGSPRGLARPTVR